MKAKTIKSLLFFVSIILFTNPIFAQKRQNIYYFTNNNKPVNTKDSADFIRIVSEPDSGSVLYNVNEYYPNGNPKLVGKSFTIDKMLFDGTCITFYPSGKKQRISTYEKGRVVDNSYEYYPNGQLYTIREYDRRYLIPDDYLYGLCLLKACNDSTGKNLATDGNGHYVTYYKDFKTVREEGDIKDGLKEGTWKGYVKYKNDSISYVEQFIANKLISGKSTVNNGLKVESYDTREITTKFFANKWGLSDFLENNLQYPKGLKTQKDQARALIQFTVERDGSLTDLKVLNTQEAAIGEEVIRVFKKSPKWTSEVYYGQVVPVTCTFNIGFTRKAFFEADVKIVGQKWITP